MFIQETTVSLSKQYYKLDMCLLQITKKTSIIIIIYAYFCTQTDYYILGCFTVKVLQWGEGYNPNSTIKYIIGYSIWSCTFSLTGVALKTKLIQPFCPFTLIDFHSLYLGRYFVQLTLNDIQSLYSERHLVPFALTDI